MVATPGVLVDRARERAGSDELGSDPWRPGFERLVEAVEREVRSDPAAVERIEALVVERLVQRLRIEAWYADHGDEARDPIEGPLVIVGLPRTATTAIHHLLAVDEGFRHLRSWELADPVPPPDAATEHADPRRPTGVRQDDVRHIVSVDGPAEDWPIHALAFDHAELTLPVPSYSVWWRDRDHGALMPYHERVLRLLQSHRPPRRWLLKMPAYLFLLAEVAEQHPDVTFVWTHRDPVVVVGSTCSTVADARRRRTPTWAPGPTFGTEQLEHWADGMQRALDARAAVGEHRFVDVAQRDLEADPVGVAERVYERAGVRLDGPVADGMAAWAGRNRRGSRGEHRYSLEEYGLDATEVAAAFEPYLDRYGDLCRSA